MCNLAVLPELIGLYKLRLKLAYYDMVASGALKKLPVVLALCYENASYALNQQIFFTCEL